MSGREVNLKALSAMSHTLRHRGPDADAIWMTPDSRVALFHRRLAIVDLSRDADQPMATPDGRFVITYNGEIYNYLELRKHLEARGATFRTHCDTEVLLHHLAVYGEAGLENLDGMFALALWDNADKSLFCARDRFGEKPFFYHLANDGSFLFGSEIKALFAHGVDPAINPSMLYRFFRSRDDAFDRDKPEETFYANVRKLESAACMRVRAGEIVSHRRYWQLRFDAAPLDIGFDDAQTRFKELFFKSVERRLQADVPVGSSLSGGVDSSSIVCAIDHLRARSSAHQHTFSARFENFALDEGRFIEEVGRKVGATAHYSWPSKQGFVEELAQVFYHQDEPFGSSSIYAQFSVMRLAKDTGVVVLLDGQGADETLTGYHHYFDEYIAELALAGSPRRAIEHAGYVKLHGRAPNPVGPTTSKGLSLSESVRRVLRPLYLRSGAYKLRDDETMLTRDFVYAANEGRGTRAGARPPSLNHALRDDLVDGKLELLLRYADRNSMAHSREVRLPFLNHELVEFVFSLPENYKICEGWSKYLLRRSMEHMLPRDICWRTDKIGFATPEAKWMSSPRIQDLKEAGKARLIADRVVNSRWTDDGSKDWELSMVGLLP